MDKSFNTQLDTATVSPLLLESTGRSIGWLRRPANGLRMISDDDLEEEDDWVDDDLEEEEEDWAEDDDLDEDDEDFDDDDDLDDDDDFDEEEDFDDDFEEDADDYEFEYRGGPGWEDGDDYDEDEYNLLGTRFASLLDDPPAGPKRFRDREGVSSGDKRPRPKKSHRPRITKRSHDEIENDDD